MALHCRVPVFVAAAILGAALGIFVLYQPAQAEQADGFFPNPATVWNDFFCIKSEVCMVGDFNGDGKDDIILFKRDSDSATDSRRGDVIVALSTGSSFVVSSQQPLWNDFFCIKSEVCMVGDFNGDGKDDIILFKRDSDSATDSRRGDVVVALSTGSSFVVNSQQPLWHDYFCIDGEQCGVGDFNGDGKDDIILFKRDTGIGSQPGDVVVALSEGYRFQPGFAPVWHDWFCVKNEVCTVGDFNGDGKDDIILFKPNSAVEQRGNVAVALSTGSRFQPGYAPLWHDWFCMSDEVCTVGDFNGDGKDEPIVFLRDTGEGTARGDVVVALSNGISFSGSPPTLWHDFFCIGGEQCAVGDFNGDGRDDILQFKRDTDMGAGRGDVAVATAGSGSSNKFFDLSISIYRSVPGSERGAYERILEQFADGVYESSNGAHKIRTVTIYQAGGNANLVDVQWNASEWPRAVASGFGWTGRQIIFGDVFSLKTQFQALAAQNWCDAGYALAHEWGHYFYGLYDEYVIKAGDLEVRDSIMNNQWRVCPTPPDFNWANFSIAHNNTGRTEQHRVYQASGWETLARPPSQDPRNGYRTARLPRPYYPELASVAPGINQNASLQMPDGRSAARSALQVVWVEPPASAAAVAAAYAATVQNVHGGDVNYPEPAMLVATVHKGEFIARAGVTASVRTPDGKTTAFSLRDDGVSPDVKKDDGVYSGYMPYNQNGAHQVAVAFDNKAGNAVYTQRGYQHAIGPEGEVYSGGLPPVGENFSVAASSTVMVRNVAADDHGNTPADATALAIDNASLTGRIDGAGDRDVFVVKPGASGRYLLRLDNFAQDMKAKIRVLAADGTSVLNSYAFTPSANQYFTATLDLTKGRNTYVEVAHRNADAAQGLYDISVGTPVAGEWYLSVYLPALQK